MYNSVMGVKTAVTALILLGLQGCATELTTFKIVDTGNSAKVKSTPGIPVPIPVLVKIITTTEYRPIPAAGAAGAALCSNPLVTESFDYLAGAESYFVNYEPSQFSDSSLEISFNEKGLASNISVNSEASGGVAALSSLVDTVLPYYQVPKVDELLNRQSEVSDSASARLVTLQRTSAEDLKAESCLIDSKSIEIQPISF